MARTIGVPNLAPANRSIYGIEDVEGTVSGGALLELYFGHGPVPLDNAPMREGDDPHDNVFDFPEVIDSVDHFYRTGEMAAPCGGPCASEL
jgi:hypothetical protein